MGYLDNSSVTIDAILTTKGRELLAQGGKDFKITKFALGDDEIDYTLWNENHPLGTAYYGIIIENMPVLEAIPDETQALRSKLVTLPKTTVNMPFLTGGPSNNFKEIKNVADTLKIVPKTNPAGITDTSYTCTISDSSVITLKVTKLSPDANSEALAYSNLATTAPDGQLTGDARSITAIGLEFEIVGRNNTIATQFANVTVTGNNTGASFSVRVQVTKIV